MIVKTNTKIKKLKLILTFIICPPTRKHRKIPQWAINLCPGPKTLSWNISTFPFRGSRWRRGNLATIVEKKQHQQMPSIMEVARPYIIRVGQKTFVTFVAMWYVKIANLLYHITQKDAMRLNPNGHVIRVWRHSLRIFQKTHHFQCAGVMCTVKSGSQQKRGETLFLLEL